MKTVGCRLVSGQLILVREENNCQVVFVYEKKFTILVLQAFIYWFWNISANKTKLYVQGLWVKPDKLLLLVCFWSLDDLQVQEDFDDTSDVSAIVQRMSAKVFSL